MKVGNKIKQAAERQQFPLLATRGATGLNHEGLNVPAAMEMSGVSTLHQ